MTNKIGDTPWSAGLSLTELGIEPMNARSVILSSLLGTHPPRQSARSLVALAERFGIRPGTARTTLSRMVAAGELEAEDSWYSLTGRLVDRQREQDEGQRAPGGAWDGRWWTVIVEADRRTVAERRAFRSLMEGARMGELRPDIWMRPGNVPAPPRSSGIVVGHASLDADDAALIGRLWDLDGIERRALGLEAALSAQQAVVESGMDAGTLPTSFMVAAAAVRFLRVEPQLPGELSPDSWTAPSVRRHYASFAAAFQLQLRDFFDRV